MRSPPGRSAPMSAPEQPAAADHAERHEQSRLRRVVVLMLIAATVLAFGNSLTLPFVFDDFDSIVNNPTIRNLAAIEEVLSPPGSGYTVQGRPTLNLSLAVCYAIGGDEPWAYHGGNLLIHALAGLTLFGIVRRTLQLRQMPETLHRGAVGLAGAVALLWLVHPLQTASVTYVIQRAESLMGLFFLLVLYCTIRGATGQRPLPWYVGAVAASAVGMGTKEVMAVAPVIVLLYDRIFLAPSVGESLRRRWPLYLGLAATWAIVGALVIGSGWRSGTAGLGSDVSPWAYAASQPKAIARYLQLSFWPYPLVLDYGNELADSPADVLPYAIFVGALLIIGLIALWRWPPIGFLFAWFFLILSPSSSIVRCDPTAADYRMYLPLAAVLTLVVLGAYRFATVLLGEPFRESSDRSNSGLRPKWYVPLGALVLAATALGVATSARNRDYQSPMQIWRDTVEKRPNNARARDALAKELQAAGKIDEALEQFAEAIRVDREFAPAWHNRGCLHYELGNERRAEADFNRAIELDPEFARAYFNRATLRGRQNRMEEAAADFSRALDIWPHFAPGYYNRGNAHHTLGEYEKAIADYTRAIELEPRYREAYIYRADSHRKLGALDAAIDDYTSLIRLNANDAFAYHERARTLAMMGRTHEARADLQRVVRLGSRPDPRLIEQLRPARPKQAQPE